VWWQENGFKVIEGNMKNCLISMFVIAQLFVVAIHAQRNQVSKINFADLANYIEDSARRDGEKFIVNNVTLVEKINYDKRYAMYHFSVASLNDEEAGNNFYTSELLIRALRLHKSDTTYMRISCTLIEFHDDFETFNRAFATKIEGFDWNGKIIWTTIGTAPAKLSFRE
jgi:hypothetical protein